VIHRYLEEIEHPMDFGTMSHKLADGKYHFMEDFGKDVELVLSNCRKFNPPQTYPADCADAVDVVFKKEWAKANERKLSWLEKRSLQGLMTTLVKEDMLVVLHYISMTLSSSLRYSRWIFREPVDPVALGIPTYFDVIPRKDARDLKTIRHRLDTDKYESIAAFEADIDLMIRNAIQFNGPESEVGQIALGVRNRTSELLANARAGPVKKRKEGEGDNPQVTKKPRLG